MTRQQSPADRAGGAQHDAITGRGAADGERAWLVFRLGSHVLCASALDVEGIIEKPASIAMLPLAPPYLLGTFLFRGHTATAVSLRNKLRVREGADTVRGPFIAARVRDSVVAFWVDEVRDVLDDPNLSWRPMPDGLGGGLFDGYTISDEEIILHTRFDTLFDAPGGMDDVAQWAAQTAGAVEGEPQSGEPSIGAESSAREAATDASEDAAEAEAQKPREETDVAEADATPPEPTQAAPHAASGSTPAADSASPASPRGAHEAGSPRRPQWTGAPHATPRAGAATPPARSAEPHRDAVPRSPGARATAATAAGATTAAWRGPQGVAETPTRPRHARGRYSAAAGQSRPAAEPALHAPQSTSRAVDSATRTPELASSGSRYTPRPPEPEPHGRRRHLWLAAALVALAVVLGALWLIPSPELPSAGPSPATAPAVASAASEPVVPSADTAASGAEARSPDAGAAAPSTDSAAQSTDAAAQNSPAPAPTSSIQGDDFKLTIERAPRRQRTRAKQPQAAALAKPRAAPQTNVRVHVVVRGDTLWAIARKYLGNPFRYPELVRYSGIQNPDLIHPGDIVRIEVRNAKR